MPLLVLGISHQTAPIEIREQVAIARHDCQQRVSQLCGHMGVDEAVILSTCNRTELYCYGRKARLSHLQDWLYQSHDMKPGSLDPYFYDHRDEEATRHLMSVAGGLESMVLGEPQILGQLKQSWQIAHEAGGVGKVLDRLFQNAFSAGKTIRTESGIGEHSVSVAYTTVVLARQIFKELTQQTVILVGAGEMIELCGRHLNEQGVTQLLIVNRSLDRAEKLAAELGAEAAPLKDLDTLLPRADILISSTGSNEHIISKAAVKKALKNRRHRPMFMADIAVPRDIETSVGDLSDVYLYTIDDLQAVVEHNLNQRQEAAHNAQVYVQQAANQFMRWLHSTRASNNLQALRSQMQGKSDDLVNKALRQIASGKDPEEVIRQLSHTLTNSLLHLPTLRLRQAAENEDYDILEAADRLFKPEKPNNDESND